MVKRVPENMIRNGSLSKGPRKGSLFFFSTRLCKLEQSPPHSALELSWLRSWRAYIWKGFLNSCYKDILENLIAYSHISSYCLQYNPRYCN